MPRIDRRPGICGEHEPDRVRPVADAQRVDLAAGCRGGDRRAHLEHVRPEDLLLPWDEVIRVVLHERGAAGASLAHGLDRCQDCGRLPVALAAEAVAVRHQALHGDARQLPQPAEVLEVRRERAESAVPQELSHPEFDARGVAQRLSARAVGAQHVGHVVGAVVVGCQRVDLCITDGVDDGHEIVHAPGIDGDAEATLGLHLVAFGDGHVAHVVAEPRQAQRAQRGRAPGCPHPGRDAVPHPRIRRVSGDGLAGHTEPALDVSELPVPVRGLVQVHEVHVDLGPRQRLRGLGVQVQHRLLQHRQPGDPHLGRRERVHPRDHADASVVGIGLEDQAADGVGAGEHRLPQHLDEVSADALERVRDAPGLVRDLVQRLRPVQALAAGQEPDLLSSRCFRCGH